MGWASYFDKFADWMTAVVEPAFHQKSKDKTPCQPPSPKPWFYPRAKALAAPFNLDHAKTACRSRWAAAYRMAYQSTQTSRYHRYHHQCVMACWQTAQCNRGWQSIWCHHSLVDWTEEPLETARRYQDGFGYRQIKDQPFILVNGDVDAFDFAQLSQLQLNDSQAYLLLTDQSDA